MNSVILSKTYSEPPFENKEILRYASCFQDDSRINSLLDDCLKELRDKLVYKVCYCELPLMIDKDCCSFGAFALQSQDLAKNLHGCQSVILMAATVGIAIDRLIARYGRISPAKALMFQAIGAERIEALCDTFCTDISCELGINLRPRFSPGYGDLSLAAQKDIFSVLDCSKKIGLSLNDSLLMSPGKSVTAFAGICNQEEKANKNRCSLCNKKDCTFRGAL